MAASPSSTRPSATRGPKPTCPCCGAVPGPPHRSGSSSSTRNSTPARRAGSAGFPVVATTSAGVAAALGYADAEGAPAGEMLAAAARMARGVEVPVTVDAGYGMRPAELVAAGVARVSWGPFLYLDASRRGLPHGRGTFVAHPRLTSIAPSAWPAGGAVMSVPGSHCHPGAPAIAHPDRGWRHFRALRAVSRAMALRMSPVRAA
jgi:hypothetical protein